MLGIQYPLVQAGMVWCSGWKLAAAVSNAGGLGIIGSGSMDPETLGIQIRKCQAATDHPFAVNVPLLYPSIGDNIDVILEEKVPIVFTSAGNPKIWTRHLQNAGRKVIHVVSNVLFAKKSEAAGCDAVVAEGFEAGGHNGREEITTLCLIPQVRAAVNIPVLAAGGIASGAAMLAVMALGADGVQIGTRFVASEESSAHPAFKQKVVETGPDGTMLAMKTLTPVRLIKNKFYNEVKALEEENAEIETLKKHLGSGRSKRGMFEGDLENGELEIGQIAGSIHQIKPTAQIVSEILAEYSSLKNEIASGERF